MLCGSFQIALGTVFILAAAGAAAQQLDNARSNMLVEAIDEAVGDLFKLNNKRGS